MAQTIKLKRSGTSGRLPTTSDLELGEVAINTYDGKMYIKKNVGGTESIVEIGGQGGGIASSFTLYEYTATSGQTTFSGSDGNSNTLAYDTGTPPKILVYLNGVLLDHTTDYTATNGTSVVLTNGAATNDLLQIAAYKSSVSTTLDIDLSDTQKLLLGDDDDLQIWHGGVDSYITNDSGNLQIVQKANDKDIQFYSDDGSGGYTEYLRMDGALGYTVASKHILFNDDVKARFGNSADLEISHDGYNSYISDVGTGYLVLMSDGPGIRLNRSNADVMIDATPGGSSSLWYDGSKKIETTSAGVSVSGTMTVQAGDAATSAYSITSNGGDLVLKAGADDVVLRTGGSGSEGIYFQDGAQDTKMFINAENGHVGIGTTSPGQKLDVQGIIKSGGIAHPEIELVPTGSVGNADIRFDGTSLDIRSNSSSAYLTLQTATTERMRIDSSGHVLIGTTDTTPYNNSADSTADRGIVLRAEGYISAAAYQQSALDINRTGNNGNVVNFYRSGTSAGSISVNDGYIGVGAGAVYLGYYTDGSNNKSIIPMSNSTGSAAAGTIGLGINNANHKFKDAWITGAVNSGSISTGNITTSGYLAGPATFTIDPAAVGDNTGTVVIAGNLQVDGTTTTINSTTLTVDDLNITLASGSANSAAANGAGITVDIANNTNPTLLYNGTLDTWEFNKRVDVTSEVRLFRSDGTRSGSLLHNTSGTVLRTNSNGDNLYLQTAGTGNVYLQPSTAGYSTVVNEDGIDSDFRVESDGNTHAFFVDAGNSRLGINTSSLTADGLIIGTNNGNCELDLHNTGGSGTRWRFNSTSSGHLYIQNKTDSTTPLTILDNGRVGIGTNTGPSSVLEVNTGTGTSTANTVIIDRAASSSYSGVTFSTNGTEDWSIGQNSTGGFQIYENGLAATTRLTIKDGGNIGIGTTSPAAKLQIEEAGIDTTTTSTTATTQVAIDTFAAATFRSARYTIQVTNSTDSTYHLTEVLLIHDGTTPQITEYGTIFTGSAEATFDADISSGNVRLLATPATTDSMTFKVVRHCITV